VGAGQPSDAAGEHLTDDEGPQRRTDEAKEIDGARTLDRLRAKIRHLERQRSLLAKRLLDAEQRQAIELTRTADIELVPELREQLATHELREQAEHERVVELEGVLAAADTASRWKDERIDELERQLGAVLSSESWRLTAPLRSAGRALRTFGGSFARRRLFEAAKPIVPVRVRRYIRRRFPTLAYVQPRGTPPEETLKAVLFVSGAPEVSRRYRCDHPLEQLMLYGATADVVEHRRLDLVAAVPHYRHFVLHRVAWGPDVESFLAAARAQGATVLFDTDDLVFDPSVMPFVAALEDMPAHEVELYEEGLHRYRRTLEAADAVTVSTDALAGQARTVHRRVVVTPNVASSTMAEAAVRALARRSQKSASADDRVTIGYLSGTNTHKRDFLEAADGLLAVLESRPHARLLVAGPLPLDSRFDRFESRLERLALRPWEELPALQACLDVNLAPLEPNNPFTDAKSCVKWIEAGLLTVPTVASPRPDFRRVVEDGENGCLAEGREEWKQVLLELVDDSARRGAIGTRARRDVLASHTTKAAAPGYHETWRKLVASADEPLMVNWVMQSPIARNSGGYRNIFRIATELGRRGHRQRICIEPVAHLAGLSDVRIKAFVEESFGMPTGAEVIVGLSRLPVADVSVATFWPTAFTVAAHGQSLFKAYLIQDFEPEFYDEDDDLYSASAGTYELPLRHICLGRHLGNRLTDFTGLPADVIDFALDPQFRLTLPPEERTGPPRVLFFARPSLRRRGYELGVEALRRVKAAHPEAEIAFFGSPSSELGQVPFEMTNLGVQDAEGVAQAMNHSHILLTFSMTNISNVPFEGMACGCAVVDLDLPNVVDMVEPGEDCLLAPLEPGAIADAITRLVEDRDLRIRLARQGAAEGRRRTWERTTTMFEDALLRLCFARLEAGAQRSTMSDGRVLAQADERELVEARPARRTADGD
jgi:glycosyltransferase involved in cell wall biosynthesis